jgi:hypothetical protein
MSSESELRASNNFGPILKADTTGLDGVHRYDIDGTSQNEQIPKVMQGKWIDLYCTADVQWGFGNGTSAPSITYNQNAALGTGNAAAAKDLPAGVPMGKRIPYDATFIAWRGAAAGGKFAFEVSEKPVTS